MIQIAFAGDTYEQPAATTAPVLIYQPSSFVVWGGNTPGLQVGQRVNFWGSQWEQQVTGGDYNARGSFKGYGTVPSGLIGLCEPTATTTGTPRLDPSCWTSKPGNSSPPATLADFIQVIVATSATKSGATVYGNIAATVVVQVDRTVPYAPDPGHPGFGTIVAVIDDGASLFPPSRTATTATAKAAATAPMQDLTTKSIAAGTRQFFLYTPEMNLLAETDLTTAQHPAIANEYIWFNGHPVAQIDSTGTTVWTFTDHLGTPILQTSAPQGIVWRAEYEPFGEVYTLRSYDRHQPLRLPGQEAEEQALGVNGVTDRSYNIHRWYRGEWGRYTTPDAIKLLASLTPYMYASDSPLNLVDPDGRLPKPPDGKWCGSSIDNPDITIGKPDCKSCDGTKLKDAQQNVDKNRTRFCKEKRPATGGELQQARGGIDVANGARSWYIPQGDPCVDYCICVHEQDHLLRVKQSPYRDLPSVDLECLGSIAQLKCLKEFSSGLAK